MNRWNLYYGNTCIHKTASLYWSSPLNAGLAICVSDCCLHGVPVCFQLVWSLPGPSCGCMAAVEDSSPGTPSSTLGTLVATGNNANGLPSHPASMVAVENASPEVIHVMSVTSAATAGTNSLSQQVVNLPGLPSALSQIPGALSQMSSPQGVHTITISAGNLSFPVTLAANPVLQVGLQTC